MKSYYQEKNLKTKFLKEIIIRVYFAINLVLTHIHILDRKLWKDGGYYLSNGASVCEEHHWKCEDTSTSVEEVREKCKIKEFILPEGFDKNKKYDKWGNEILSEYQRKKGILFQDDGVQKILKKAGIIYLYFD